MYKNFPGKRQTLRRNIRKAVFKMIKRILTAIVGLAVFFAVIMAGMLPLKIAVGLVVLAMLYEVYGAITKSGAVKSCGYLCALVFMAGIVIGKLKFALTADIIITMFYAVFLHEKANFRELFAVVLMTLYITLFMSYILVVRSGRGLSSMGLIFIIAWGSDTAAYFCGTLFGKHKLMPKVSPKKTVEGSIGAVIITAGLCVLYMFILGRFDILIFGLGTGASAYVVVAVLGVIASAMSQIGDLAASVIKRDTGIKDYGKIFPGHGGFMDRFDSVLYIAPVIYYFPIFYAILFYISR